ncbi:Shikimate kinase [Nitrospira japonica]|uniref:Shikimate kinase n=1 Tax=Nitrospira japonica TaxID=1325564 RepID=A0A1W1I3V0_9BACT|nr:shikimate kinase [Nitrospira japonica]SLM47674.1 Shikimate kinase [Nitrospira japonica]
MNIVLIGYRGVGKSSVGKILASQLKRELISTDAEVIRRAGQTIPAIVEQHGWEYFRERESDVCRDLSVRDNLIIDTGGGAILRPHNVDALKANGKLFWLTASVESIAARIGGDTQRPSLTGTKSFVEEIEEVLRERTPKYRAAADCIVTTDGQLIEQVVEQIIGDV